jgi:cytochrome oxidase Cu insertion factor (SCO1/SenC/PrrC family)
MFREVIQRFGAGSWRLAGRFAFLAALVLVGALSAKNRALQREVRRLHVEEKIPHAGVVVPTFPTATLTGDSVTIGSAAPGTRQVLFFFNTTCGFCIQTLPMWKSIATQLTGLGRPVVNVFGIALDSADATARYVAAHHLDFPVVRFSNGKTAALYRAVGVPITVVLDDDGNVLYGRGGALNGSAVDSVMAAVGAGKPDSLILAARRGR